MRKRGTPPEIPAERDERTRQEERYRIYTLAHDLRCIAATETLEAIGPCLDQLRKEEQITHNTRVGIKDDVTRTWLVNPFGKGDRDAGQRPDSSG